VKNWLILGGSGVAAAGVATVVTLTVFRSPEKVQEKPSPQQVAMSIVPPDASVVLYVTDTDSALRKGEELFTWLAPVAEAIVSQVVGSVVPSPWPDWLPLPNPFASAAEDSFNKSLPGGSIPGFFRDTARKTIKEIRPKLVAAGMDLSRPQVFFAYVRADKIPRGGAAGARAGPDDMPVSLVHCVPIKSQQSFSYAKLLEALSGGQKTKPPEFYTSFADGYALVSFDKYAKEKVDAYLKPTPRPSIWQIMTPGEQSFMVGQDLCLYVPRLDLAPGVAGLMSAEPNSPSAERAAPKPGDQAMALIEKKLQNEFRSISLGGTASAEGISFGAYLATRDGTNLRRLLLRSAGSSELLKGLPPRSVFAGQISCTTELRKELIGDTGVAWVDQLIAALPESGTFAVVGPPSPQELLSQALKAGPNARTTPPKDLDDALNPFATGVLLLSAIRSDADYLNLRKQAGDLLLSLAGKGGPGGTPTLEIKEGVHVYRGARVDQIALRYPVDRGKSTDPLVNPGPLALTLLSFQHRGRGGHVAAFIIGLGSKGLVELAIDSMGSGENLGDSPAFKPVRRFVPQKPIFLAVGPMTAKGEGPLDGLAEAMMGDLGEPRPKPRKEETEYYTSLAAISSCEGDLRVDLFLSAGLCKDFIGSATSTGLNLLGLLGLGF
jgi:hypothetical protein